jgi:hypothetical protein
MFVRIVDRSEGAVLLVAMRWPADKPVLTEPSRVIQR